MSSRMHAGGSDWLAATSNYSTLTPARVPYFRTHPDADLTTAIYRRVPVLVDERAGSNPWSLDFVQGLFNMTSDSHLFRDTPRPERVPLYEAKFLHQFDHRFATYQGATQEQINVNILPRLSAEQKADPAIGVQPRYWVDRSEVDARLAGRWEPSWILGWRRIGRSTDVRTMIAAVLPRTGVSNNIPLLFPGQATARLAAGLIANLNSLVHVGRKTTGGGARPDRIKHLNRRVKGRHVATTSGDCAERGRTGGTGAPRARV
jgi:hypothetical protein